MELEPGKRYEFTGTITPAAPASAPGLPGWAYKTGIGAALIAALWLIGQQSHGAAPAGTPSPTTTQPADGRPGPQEAHK